MKEKIKEIMASVFDIEVSEITEDSSPDTIESWDSLRAMNLVASLEEEFGIQFTDEELTEMLNFKLIETIVEEKTKK